MTLPWSKPAALPWFLEDGNAAIDSYIKADNWVCVDFENELGFATDPAIHLVLACWYVVRDGVVTKKHIFGDEYDMEELLEDIRAADFMVAHNAKYECQWLQRCGLETRDLLVYCTQNAEWVLLGNNPDRLSLSLDETAERRLGERKDALGKGLISTWGVCPSDTPQGWLKKYCYQDVDLTYRIFLQQKEEISARGVWHLVLQRNLVAPVLADIELAGLQLDKERVYAEYEKLMADREVAATALDEVTGGINLNSRPQLAAFLYDQLGFQEAVDSSGNTIRTGGGGRSTSEEALGRLVAHTPEQEKFLKLYGQYSEANVLLTKTLEFFKNVCDYYDGVFYGSINQGRTDTHRLASSGIEMWFPSQKKPMRLQLQNIPRKYKNMFTCHDERYVNLEADGAQLEFRVSAQLGADKQAIHDIVNGVDIHSFTRDVMREAGHPDFVGLDDKEARQMAKPRTFAPLYGGRGTNPAEQAYADAWKEKYPDLYATQYRWTLTVADQKKLVTPYGLTFHWPHAKIYPSGYVSKSTEIFNYTIQGMATGEIIPIALVYYWHRTKHLDLRIWNTVHDSLVARVREDQLEEATQIAKQCLTTDVYQFLSDVYKYEWDLVPLGVGCKASRNWSEGKLERTWDVWRSGEERYQEKD